MNWLQPPPGCSAWGWLSIFAEVLSNFLDIRIAGRNLIVSTSLWLIEQKQSSVSGIYPTLKDVYHVIKGRRYPAVSHSARYQETICNRLQGLLAVFGDNICSQRRLNWDKFISTNWAISLEGLPLDFQNVLISVVTAKILTYRIVNNLRSSHLELLFVFDEGSTVFRKWYEKKEGTYILTDYLSRCREYGTGFIIGTQNLTSIADSVLSNTGIKILVGGAGLGADYETFASATGMTRDQKEFLRTLTMPGQACVKDPRYPHPFTIEVPKIVQ
ncbi:hypothetical protein HY405_00375 [Candidatus Microgenomates bacterium]|nr:hypothetical protein [Candidatus Microgenomates bacterium]